MSKKCKEKKGSRKTLKTLLVLTVLGGASVYGYKKLTDIN